MKWLPWLINAASMLFLTMAAAPAILGGANFPELARAILFRARYFS